MKNLSIDIETYSSTDLSKCGVYKYTENLDFEILLFGYAVDGGEVQVVDLAQGEKIPAEIINALTNDNITKWAFNANFERVCLSAYIKKYYSALFVSYSTEKDTVKDYLDPSAWKCSMVWSAYMGLPLSLKGVGVALGLEEQKLDEGKSLIRYFCAPCKPTKVNGGRTRNLPMHSPEKWELFKAYNKRDVEVEMNIQRKLKNFPAPDFIWDEYHLDQEINDRGISLDMELVNNAINFDELTKTQLRNDMQEITQLENPNSVIQMREWLAENGLETDSLGKDSVKALLKTAPPNLKKVLELRQQLAKSSVKKYQAMQNAVCKDNRARGMFQFYGANRSGRFCLTGEHEVLTDTGWCRLDEWNDGCIACWNPRGEIISFQKSKALSFEYKGDMYHYSDSRIDQISTPEHKMYVKKRYDGDWTVDTVENMTNYRPSIPFIGYRQVNSGMEHSQLRVLIMVQADGCYTDDGSIVFGFTKIRKVERCKMLLRVAGIQFIHRIYQQKTNQRHQIKIYSRNIPLWLRLFKDKTFDTWLFDESADVFFDELVYWDGYRSDKNSIQYATCNKKNADVIQAFAHLSGRAAKIRAKIRGEEHPNWNDAYYVDIWLTPKNCHEIRTKPTISTYEGKVYCAETPTGYFLVRRNGKVWVTGNSGRHIQLQNLPQNHIPDLKEARTIVKNGDFESMAALYDNIQNVLSELIRTAFVPKQGYKFIVADFSAIEARVIAWLAGEQWRIDVFEKGGDIYCASASQMFGVPVEKNGVNGHLRQKGKIAELALGYGGSVGALKSMGAVDMGISEEELQPLVTAWRNSNPHITKLWWDVDNAVKKVVKEKTYTEVRCIKFFYKSGMLFITLPSGRSLTYIKPRIGENRFGGESVTYEGVGAAKKWERIESYGPKFVENIVQAIARDILLYAMKTLRHCFIAAHVHDEIIIEAGKNVSLNAVCEQMGKTPPWAKGLKLRADGYECEFYKKE